MTLPKRRFFVQHFSHRCKSNFNHFDVIGPQSYRILKNNTNNGHYTVCATNDVMAVICVIFCGDSRSLISVPIESPYATYVNNRLLTYILSHTVSGILRIIGQLFGVEGSASV